MIENIKLKNLYEFLALFLEIKTLAALYPLPYAFILKTSMGEWGYNADNVYLRDSTDFFMF